MILFDPDVFEIPMRRRRAAAPAPVSPPVKGGELWFTPPSRPPPSRGAAAGLSSYSPPAFPAQSCRAPCRSGFRASPDAGSGRAAGSGVELGTPVEHAQVAGRVGDRAHQGVARSEGHTSDLQSLMRITYAVFCLKKKK